MRIGFIGAGKVGSTLAKYFLLRGIEVVGFYSRTYANAKLVSDFTGTKAYANLSDLLKACDCLFITVPDHQINTVWNNLCQLSIDKHFVGHCSGLLSSEIFTYDQSIYPFGFSLHPLYAIYDRFNCYLSMAKAYFTLEARDTILSQLMATFAVLNNPVATLTATKKPLYHAACVMLSNQVIALAQIGSNMLKQCDLEPQFCEQAWHQLFLGNAQAICHQGLQNALTGPIERGDIETIKQHLAVLPADVKAIYQQLSRILIEISQQKHPQRDYNQLQLELLP